VRGDMEHGVAVGARHRHLQHLDRRRTGGLARQFERACRIGFDLRSIW